MNLLCVPCPPNGRPAQYRRRKLIETPRKTFKTRILKPLRQASDELEGREGCQVKGETPQIHFLWVPCPSNGRPAQYRRRKLLETPP